MQSENLLTNQWEPANSLSEPHFDDETTLISARQVIPLAEVRSQSRRRRRLLFGLAMAAALMIGAAGATAIFSWRGQSRREVVSSTITDDRNSQPSSHELQAVSLQQDQGGGTTGVKDLVKTGLSETRTAQRSELQPKSGESKPKRHKEKISRDFADGQMIQDQDADSAGNLKDQRREARREARRQRREQEDNGDRDSDNSQGLLRIREIFEGKRKP